MLLRTLSLCPVITAAHCFRLPAVKTVTNIRAFAKSMSSSSGGTKPFIVVFGGNGFVGQHVCENALRLGLDVVSISRGGRPHISSAPSWLDSVKWRQGDAGDPTTWPEEVQHAEGVVSCIGAFGSNEAMQRINGDLNIKVINETHKLGVKRFTFISTADNSMPSFFLPGYFNGKLRAEEALSSTYGNNGTVLRPGFIYGVRQTSMGGIPLQYIGSPLRCVLKLTRLESLRTVPGLSMFLTPPVPAEDVGLAAAAAAGGLAVPFLDTLPGVQAVVFKVSSEQDSGKDPQNYFSKALGDVAISMLAQKVSAKT